jgi:hypothetical protein
MNTLDMAYKAGLSRAQEIAREWKLKDEDGNELVMKINEAFVQQDIVEAIEKEKEGIV